MTLLNKLHTFTRDNSPEQLEAWEKLLYEIIKEISLPESLYKRLEGHYKSIAELLCAPKDPELSDLMIFPQGSVLTRTLTRALPGSDVDVDAVAFRQQGTRLTPRQWMDSLLKELTERVRTSGHVKRRKRCVTVKYDDSVLPAHVDVTLAIPTPGNAKADGTGPLEVPDYPSDRWHPTNPKDFAAWVNDVSKTRLPLAQTTVRFAEALAKADVQPMPNHEDSIAFDPLRVAIKLAKRHRDLFARRNRCEDFQPLSVIITTLIGKAYLRVAMDLVAGNRQLTLPQALEAIADQMVLEFDATVSGSGYWVLRNPRRPDENFAEKWNSQPEYAAVFFQWHEEFKRALQLGLLQFAAREQFQSVIEESFGDGPERVAERWLNKAARENAPMPGLTLAAAQKLRDAETAASRLLGLSAAEPRRAQQPRDLGRLG